MKMFECMAARCTVLTSDLPVLREVLDESMAVFYPQDDTGSWESALCELLNDSKRRQVLGRRARAAVEQYSWVARAQRVMEGFYEISA
jgi:glycosyltransferase involved in cell wall biosynthesis